MKHNLVLVNEAGKRIGQSHHRAKLTDADVEQIFALREFGLSYVKIAGKFDDIEGGISKETVRDILTGRTRWQVPFATRRVPVTDLEPVWLPALPEEFVDASLGVHIAVVSP